MTWFRFCSLKEQLEKLKRNQERRLARKNQKLGIAPGQIGVGGKKAVKTETVCFTLLSLTLGSTSLTRTVTDRLVFVEIVDKEDTCELLENSALDGPNSIR